MDKDKEAFVKECKVLLDVLLEEMQNNPKKFAKEFNEMYDEFLKGMPASFRFDDDSLAGLSDDPKDFEKGFKQAYSSLLNDLENDPEKFATKFEEMDTIMSASMQDEPELLEDPEELEFDSEALYINTTPMDVIIRDLKAAYIKEKNPDVRARMIAVNMVCIYSQGVGYVADLLMQSSLWVAKWADLFEEGGIDAILDHPRK